MRIVGGMWRGQAIEAPAGRDTRPTTDRMRESIASMVLSAMGLALDEVSVLDAFAGSGGMGLELLSRGAKRCTFCDKDRRACAVVRKNCASLKVPSQAYAVACTDVFKAAQQASLAGAPFDVVFLDPPYAMDAERVQSLLQCLMEQSMLATHALIVYERAATSKTLEVEGLDALRTKKHGGTCIDLLRAGGTR